MKKLMIAMTAVAMVGAANAAATYNYRYDLAFKPYAAKDTSPSTAHQSWYSCYCMTQATAQELLDTTKTVTYSDVANWLGKNFTENSAAVVDAAQACPGFYGYFPKYYLYGSKDFTLNYFATQCNDYISVFLFNNGTDLAYNVLPGDGKMNLGFYSDESAVSGSGWIAAVPEPTSGLLMLLGMAGLALKRKRA